MPEINFAQLIQDLDDAKVAESDLPVVWSGEFGAERLDEFLNAWSIPRAEMPWCLWEQVDQIVLEKETKPKNLELLEYGRMFGDGGDLSLNRDEERFFWLFVGPPDSSKPNGFTSPDNFWTQQNNAPIRVWNESVLLWGEKHQNENRWIDDRVAQARLIYPDMQSSRVQLTYSIYTSGGQIQLVWLLGLEAAT